jgi:UDP-glucose 4-epimerase
MDLKGKVCVVTGGAGFIGSHVVDLLTSLGATVTVIDDLSVGREQNLEAASKSGRVRLIKADVRDQGRLEEAFSGAERVFHLAVKCLRVSIADPLVVHEVNATGTLCALEAARRRACGRFVYVSSSEVYGSAKDDSGPIRETDPLSVTTPYGASKAAGELYAVSYFTSYGTPVTIVRPFNSYGPRSHASGPYGEVIPRFVARALQREAPVIFGDGAQTRDFTYVEDTARGIVAAAFSDRLIGEAVNIGSGREISIVEIARMALEACGTRGLVPIHEGARPGDVRRHLASTGKAEELLKYRAEIDFKTGLKRYVEWVRKSGVEVGPDEARAQNW